MPFEQFAYLLDTQQHAGFILSTPKIRLHALADGFPLGGEHVSMHASICNDFDVTVGKQEIDEYAIAVLGVPHPQL